MATQPRRQTSVVGSILKALFIVFVIISVLALLCGGGIIGLMFCGVGKVRESASEVASSTNAKQLAHAMHNYHDTNGHMPASLMTKDGKPGLSWRVAILPYIDQQALYDQFKLDEPWNSPNNIKLLDKMPQILVNPRMTHPANETCYRIFVGGGAMFEHGKKTRLSPIGMSGPDVIFIPDGTANTLMIAEATGTIPWTMPVELEYVHGGPLPPLGPANESNFVVAFADGSVRAFPRGIDPERLHAAITAAGSETISLK